MDSRVRVGRRRKGSGRILDMRGRKRLVDWRAVLCFGAVMRMVGRTNLFVLLHIHTFRGFWAWESIAKIPAYLAFDCRYGLESR